MYLVAAATKSSKAANCSGTGEVRCSAALPSSVGIRITGFACGPRAAPHTGYGVS